MFYLQMNAGEIAGLSYALSLSKYRLFVGVKYSEKGMKIYLKEAVLFFIRK